LHRQAICVLKNCLLAELGLFNALVVNRSGKF
jgi:hypothetical protein